MEHFIDIERVDNCLNMKRKGKCRHISVRSYRREKNLFYVKDYIYCDKSKTKEVIKVKRISIISPVDFWALGIIRYGDKNAIL